MLTDREREILTIIAAHPDGIYARRIAKLLLHWKEGSKDYWELHKADRSVRHYIKKGVLNGLIKVIRRETFPMNEKLDVIYYVLTTKGRSLV